MIYDAHRGDNRYWVRLDGVLIERIVRCNTGKRGWVEQLLFTRGRPILDKHRKAIRRRRLRGCVEVGEL